MTIGIIGLGSFGAFVAKVLAPYATIIGYDANQSVTPADITIVSINQVAAADIVILAIPLDIYPTMLTQIKPLIRPETLVVDVCSVKVKSRDIMLELLDGHDNILVCHPLFGPQSASKTTVGHDIIVTNAIGERAQKCVTFFQDELGLNVYHKTAEEHDKIMAFVHVLTFFVARGLHDMNLPEVPFQTPSYSLITNLVNFNNSHSNELFTTIQEGNPYASELRHHFVETFDNLSRELDIVRSEKS